MSPSGTFDVWLIAFERTAADRAAQQLGLAFGLEHRVALRLLSDLPCRVKTRTDIVDAQGIADALIALGGQAEVMRSDELPAVAPPAPALAPPAPPESELGFEPLASQIEPYYGSASAAQDAWHARFVLSAWDRAPSMVRPMRDPSQRERPPRVRPGAQRTSADVPAAQRLADPLKLTAGVIKAAGQSSWQTALSGHPVLGFLLVLTLTTAVFLAFYTLARGLHAEPDAETPSAALWPEPGASQALRAELVWARLPPPCDDCDR